MFSGSDLLVPKAGAAEAEPSNKKSKVEDGSEQILEIKEEGIISTESEEVRKPRKRKFKKSPYLKLKSTGVNGKLTVPVSERTPIFLNDIKNLILLASLGNSPRFPHSWCSFERLGKLAGTVVLIVENLSEMNYTNNQSLFHNLNYIFVNKLEILTPAVYKGDLIEDLATVCPITTKNDSLIKEYESFKQPAGAAKVFKSLEAVFPVKKSKKQMMFEQELLSLPVSDKFPRTHLLLATWELVEHNYPLPLGPLKQKYARYIMTKDVYDDVTQYSPMFGLDCEMCLTTTGRLEITRVSIVNEQYEIIYEKLVKPHSKVIDYITSISGITSSMLQDVTTRIKDVQQDLRNILPPDAILVGQSLNTDLQGLKVMHPYIIDTSVIFNSTGNKKRKSKLKDLVREHLNITIQSGNQGHNSIEDAISALKLVQFKLQRDLEFGNPVLLDGCNFQNYSGVSLLHHITKNDKRAQIIAKKDVINRYKMMIHENDSMKITCVEQESDKQIVDYVQESSKYSDIIFAHVKLSEEAISENQLAETCESVDKYVEKVWQYCPFNTLCVVLFGGNVRSNGAGFIIVKRAVQD